MVPWSNPLDYSTFNVATAQNIAVLIKIHFKLHSYLCRLHLALPAPPFPIPSKGFSKVRLLAMPIFSPHLWDWSLFPLKINMVQMNTQSMHLLMHLLV